MKKIYLSVFVAGLLFSNNVKSQNIYSENFDVLSDMFATGGWMQVNNSIPLGPEIWHNGINLAIPAYNGAADSYAEASFSSTDSVGTGNISNWLISPTINLNNGDLISFFTTSFNNSIYPDRLELRLNRLNTTNVGNTDTTTGDFTELLLSINPSLLADTAQYPQGYWGQFTAAISTLAGSTPCRLAFRYNVINGGGAGANSSTIGVDALSVDMPVGISNSPASLDLSVYPNPSSDRITFDFFKPLTEKGVVHIYNTMGQSVSTFEVLKGQSKAQFNISSLADGSYSFVLEVPGSVTKRNFIKN